MTLIVTINGPESIWLLADRRLSNSRGPTKEDARKLLFLETVDGLAILGYAGLGATALGTEPADWMAAVLRGRNLPLEQSLGVVADAMQRQFPRHLARLPKGLMSHTVLASAFLNGEPRFYTIDMVLEPDRKRLHFRYTRHVRNVGGAERTPRLSIGGSGAIPLIRNRGWMRPLLRMVKAHDRGRVSARAVADHLAKLNNQVHDALPDKSVGIRCIVAWRHRKGGVHKGGGAQQFYSGVGPDNDGRILPTIANGNDLGAFLDVLWKRMMQQMGTPREAGEPLPAFDFDEASLNAELAQLPDAPDEDLR